MVALEPTQQEGFIERAYYREPSLYEVEREYVFEHTWQYVGHESELAQPGAFKRATVAEQPLLVVRGSDGQIRVFLNSCRHRAAIVEPRDCGKAPAFRCIYHHWQYATDGRLINVPEASGFGEWFRKEDFGLVEVPKLESFNGLLFVSLDPEIEPLQQFLGPVTDHLREAFSTTGEPWQVITSYSYRIRANWKLFMENTVEGYHASYLHQVAINQSRGGRVSQRQAGRALDLGHHGTLEWMNTGDAGWQKHVLVFPNLLVLYHHDRDTLAIRHVQPENVASMDIRVYAFGHRSEPEQRRNARLERFNVAWGPGGRNGADDTEALELVQEGLKAKGAGLIIMARGLGGPPVAAYEDEQPIRAFWRGWRHYMARSGKI